MIIYLLVYYLYFIALVGTSIVGLYRYKSMDKGSKVLLLLVCCALVNESVAYFLAKKYHDNLQLYTVYCLLEYGLICLYFNYVIDVFTRKNIGLYIAGGGILLGIVNALYIQPINSINSYFLFFEGLLVIGMSLFAFFRLLLKFDSLHLYRYHHFWLICILVFFWSITFLNWGLYDYFNLRLRHSVWKINFALMTVGVVTYGGIGVVFLLYPKMHTPNE